MLAPTVCAYNPIHAICCLACFFALPCKYILLVKIHSEHSFEQSLADLIGGATPKLTLWCHVSSRQHALFQPATPLSNTLKHEIIGWAGVIRLEM